MEMVMYEVVGRAAAFFSGCLRLTKEQAAARAHALETIGEGLCRIIKPVEFKAGEVVGYDGIVNKAIAHKLEPVAEAVEESVDTTSAEAGSAEAETAEKLGDEKGKKKGGKKKVRKQPGDVAGAEE